MKGDDTTVSSPDSKMEALVYVHTLHNQRRVMNVKSWTEYLKALAIHTQQ